MEDEDEATDAAQKQTEGINFHEHARKTAANARKVQKQIKQRKWVAGAYFCLRS